MADTNQPNQTAKAPGLNTAGVKDNLPLVAIWRQVMNEILSAVGVVAVVSALFLIFMVGFGVLIWRAASNSDPVQTLLAVVFAVAFIAVILLGLVSKVAKKTRVMLRAESLARANGFNFIKGVKNPGYPGLILSIGDTRNSLSIIEGSYKNHSFKAFNYSYMEGSGKNREEHNKGVIMVKLPRKVPNVVFDSKANNIFGMSSLGTTFGRSQRFSFEGDFNKHFDVYAPQNYGRDVLYFMTPELMALLVDEANNYDIEVVDDNLFFYAPEFDFKKQQLEAIFKLIATLGGEFSDNTQRYADERVGDKTVNMIAEPGRRLKRGISWISVVVIIIYILLQVLPGIISDQ